MSVRNPDDVIDDSRDYGEIYLDGGDIQPTGGIIQTGGGNGIQPTGGGDIQPTGGITPTVGLPIKSETSTATTPKTFGEVIRALDEYKPLTADNKDETLGTLTASGDKGSSAGVFTVVFIVAVLIGGYWFYKRRLNG